MASYSIETYAIFKNVDSSILKTNRVIEKFGYKFVAISLDTLIKEFSALLPLPKKFETTGVIMVFPNNDLMLGEYHEAIGSSQLFGPQTLADGEVILLRRISDFEQEHLPNHIDFSKGIGVLSAFQKFVSSLVQQFRLFKNGDIECVAEFQITKEKRNIERRIYRRPSKTHNYTKFLINDGDVGILSKTFVENFKTNQLTELCLSNFNLSYEIQDLRTKYITLMTCLESLFNQGRDQITHTVSRHLSLIVSDSPEEFDKNYYRTKALYGFRSGIVHGDKINEDLSLITDELQNKVRLAINYCLKIEGDKKQLFDRLNKLGYKE